MRGKEADILGYLPGWEDKPQSQVVEEIASYSLETKKSPDPYYFLIEKNGKLKSPQTGKLVEDSVEKDSEIGAREFEALQRIQNWSHDHNSGTVFWISPPHSARSSSTKIIISEIIEGGQGKTLFNRAILFDHIDVNYDYYPLTNDLANYSVQTRDLPLSLEDFRSKPIFTTLRNTEWIEILEKYINIPEVWQQIRAGNDLIAKQKALENSSQIYEELFSKNYPRGFDDLRIKKAVETANETNLFGKFGSSCPSPLMRTTAFEVLSENSFQNEKFFQCPKCEKPIPSGQGITKCPHCGITKEEVGGNCD